MYNARVTYTKEDGMTLVEVLIALSVFSIFIVMAIAGFTQLLRNQRLTLLMMEANDNVSSAIEQMSREIRTSDNVNGGGSQLSFTDLQTSDVITYTLSNGQIMKKINSGTAYAITTKSAQVSISLFNVTIQSTTPKRVTLNIGVQVQDSNAGSFTTYLQTTVSPRVYYHNN